MNPNSRSETTSQMLGVVLSLFALFSIPMFFASCTQPEEDESQYNVRYTVLVTNVDGESLEGAEVILVGQSGDSVHAFTGEAGSVTLPSITSMQNQFVVRKSGYQPGDSVDWVPTPSDTTVVTILRVMHLSLDTLSDDTSSGEDSANGKVAYTLLVLDSNTQAAVTAASIRITCASLDTSLTTDSLGLAESAIIQASQCRLVVSKSSYATQVRLDTIPAIPKNEAAKVTQKLLEFRLQPQTTGLD